MPKKPKKLGLQYVVKTDNAQKNTAKGDNAAEGKKPIIPHTDPSPTESGQSQQKWYKSFAGWKPIIKVVGIAFGKVVGIAFGVGYAVVTFNQWRDSNRNFALDERAWVSVMSAKLTRPYSMDSKGIITVTLANTGKTPALHMKVVSAAFSDREDGVELIPNVGAETVAPPGSMQNTITLAVRSSIPSDTKLFVRFVLTYRDVLQKPSDLPHTTTFCGFYPPDDSAEDRTTLMACPNGGNTMN